MGCLYALEFGNGRRYIGVTVRTLSERIAQHREVSRKSERHLYRAWRKYGEPRVRELARGNGDYLFDMERRAIAAYKTQVPDGYNLTEGGEYSRSAHPVVRAKMSASRKRYMTPERRAEISARVRAFNAKKIAEQGYVFRLSGEAKEKIAASKRGKPLSAHTRAKVSAALAGRKLPDDVCAKMSASRRGKTIPEDVRKKISDSLKSSDVYRSRKKPERDSVSGRYLAAP